MIIFNVVNKNVMQTTSFPSSLLVSLSPPSSLSDSSLPLSLTPPSLPLSLTPHSLSLSLMPFSLYIVCSKTALIILSWLHKVTVLYLVAMVVNKNNMGYLWDAAIHHASHHYLFHGGWEKNMNMVQKMICLWASNGLLWHLSVVKCQCRILYHVVISCMQHVQLILRMYLF